MKKTENSNEWIWILVIVVLIVVKGSYYISKTSTNNTNTYFINGFKIFDLFIKIHVTISS